MILQSVGTMTVPLILHMNIYVFWAWLSIRQYQGVLDHVGYENLPFWIDPFSHLPGGGGTRFHDDHHKHFTCNYASLFRIIDVFFGTDYRGKASLYNNSQTIRNCSRG
jgi:sterol desaturase/sphingolipid hydroxylase (fatty acid hydroxylase superfamily)